jgi:hypothetical protein
VTVLRTCVLCLGNRVLKGHLLQMRLAFWKTRITKCGQMGVRSIDLAGVEIELQCR